MNGFLESIKHFLSPLVCAVCATLVSEVQEEVNFLCVQCFESIQPISTATLRITEKMEGKVFAVSDYKDPLRSLVLAKHSRNRVAAQRLGILLWQKSNLRYADFDYIVPLPLHWTRYAWRWYNQAEVMAEEISRLSGKPLLHLIKRSRRTISQTGLSRKEREHNMKNAFVLEQDEFCVKGKTVLFVDDVITTGTTLRAAIAATRPLKMKNFLVGVACRRV